MGDSKGTSCDVETIYDVVIVGGGLGGISAAVEAEAAGLEYLLLEKDELANTIKTRYADGKKVEMDYHGVVAEYIGEIDFGAGIRTRDEFISELAQCVKDHALNYLENDGVSEISRNEDGLFLVKAWSDTYVADNVIIAIGQFGRPNTLPKWKDEKSGYPRRLRALITFSLDDPDKYDGLDVLVIGGGDTAIETAVMLKDLAAVDISYRRPAFVLGERLSQDNFDDIHNANDADELEALMQTNLTSAVSGEKDDDGRKTVDVTLEHDDGTVTERTYHKLFLCLGGTTPVGFLEQAGITVDGKKPNIDENTLESLDVSGLYVIGDLSGRDEKSIVTAVKQGVLAVNDIKDKLE